MTDHAGTTNSDGVAVSAYGSQITHSRRGSGATVILVAVAGALVHRGFGAMRKIVDQLVDAFTVVTYDRRDRGESSASTRHYEVAEEFQDLQALIDTLGGHAHLFGWSSGASLVLQAAPSLEGVDSIAIYETPYIIDDSRAPHPDGYIARHDELAAQGRNAALIDYSMTVGIGLPRIIPTLSRLNPQWRKRKALAPTLAHDAGLVNPYARASTTHRTRSPASRSRSGSAGEARARDGSDTPIDASPSTWLVSAPPQLPNSPGRRMSSSPRPSGLPCANTSAATMAADRHVANPPAISRTIPGAIKPPDHGASRD